MFPMLFCSQRRGSCRGARRGVATVECVLVATIACVLFFAAFEYCRVAVIRHTVDNAVYEGTRRGILPGGTAQEVSSTARGILASIGVRDARIKVTPANNSDTSDEVTLSIRVPLDSNSMVPTNLFRGQVIERTLTMRREGPLSR